MARIQYQSVAEGYSMEVTDLKVTRLGRWVHIHATSRDGYDHFTLTLDKEEAKDIARRIEKEVS